MGNRFQVQDQCGGGPMPVTEKTFETVVLEEDDARWELHRGRLRESR